MKKFLQMIMCSVFLIFSAVPKTAMTEKDGIFEYSVSSGTATVAGCSDAVGDLVIPNTLGGYPVTGIGNYAFYGCDNLSVVVYLGTQQRWKNISINYGNDHYFYGVVFCLTSKYIMRYN